MIAHNLAFLSLVSVKFYNIAICLQCKGLFKDNLYVSALQRRILSRKLRVKKEEERLLFVFICFACFLKSTFVPVKKEESDLKKWLGSLLTELIF